MSSKTAAGILLLSSALVLPACEGPPAGTQEASAPRVLATAPRDPLALGQDVYRAQCAPCHGVQGDGLGEAAWLLYPRPRDFTRGEYRLVSTWDGVPTDEDLFATITRGMPGSAMPAWSHLDEETRWALVAYLKSFADPEDLLIEEDGDPPAPMREGTGVIRVPPEPAYTADAAARARELFAKNCALCHGEGGRGDARQPMVDSQGLPTLARDLTAGVFKGTPTNESVYRRIVAGLPGSPMPSSPVLYGDDAWDLVHYVLSLSSPAQRSKVEMKRLTLTARRVEQLPGHPDAGAWGAAEPADVHLMPLWWRPARPESVSVRALHDGRELALLLVWHDETWDSTAIRPQDFRDAAAVQLALTPDPPFLAMGEAGGPVNVWMWKSERQADLETAFQDLDRIYPNLGIDSYPNLLRSPLEQPTRHALTLQSDPTFVTAWGAGNVVADPLRRSAAEDLSAQGFGTLRARPEPDRWAAASGVWATGSYRVQFQRALASPGAGAAELRPGSKVPVAFAVWNGSAGDRDGKKSVTLWQDLVLQP